MIFSSGCSIFFWRGKDTNIVFSPESLTVPLGDAGVYSVTLNTTVKIKNRECALSVFNEAGNMVVGNPIIMYSSDMVNMTTLNETDLAVEIAVVFDTRVGEIEAGDYVLKNLLNCSIYNKKWSKVKDVKEYWGNMTVSVVG